MARMIASAVQMGNVVHVYDERGSTMCILSVGGQYASDGLQGYTSSTVTIRRGSAVFTYNEKGHTIQTHPAGPPTPKNNAVAPYAKSKQNIQSQPARPVNPKNNATAHNAKAKSESAPVQRNWFPLKQVQQPIPIPTDPRNVAQAHDYDHSDTDEPQSDIDTGDTEISEMVKEIPAWVRDFAMMSDRYRRRWKRLAITFMILFSLLLSVIVLAIAV